MATYILQISYTQQGIQNIKDSPARINAFKNEIRSAGAEQKAIYLVMGKYDFLAITEMPDDKTAAKICLAVNSLGNVRTQTFRAFSEDEFQSIIDSLP